MENVRQALDAYWRRRLEEARDRYYSARTAANIARDVHGDVPPPKESFAFYRILRVEREALAEYARIRSIFNAVVTRGKIPIEGEGDQLANLIS